MQMHLAEKEGIGKNWHGHQSIMGVNAVSSGQLMALADCSLIKCNLLLGFKISFILDILGKCAIRFNMNRCLWYLADCNSGLQMWFR